ncbi:MAG: hydroxyethylthiazole kinase [Acidobacteria bacterium]|nr:hydroxyethylthiazole kinase [Acidobacteriota bacterium]
MTTPSAVWSDVVCIRETAPLVHNITNFVVMNTTANALLAIGASPVMAHAIDEVEDMVRLAGALVINIGTLSPAWVDAMVRAGKEASRIGIPIVVDPVGAGATRYRTETAQRLGRDVAPAIIRGNASEIRALVQADATTRGVDSMHATGESIEHARRVAGQYRCAVSMSGATDIIVSADATARVDNGHPMMPRVTGLGCAATALTGAFAAVNPSAFEAALHAMIVMGVAGEIAAERAAGPGSFWVQFLDALYALQQSDITARMRASDG